MPITAITSYQTTEINPVGDCLLVQFSTDEIITTSGVIASLIIDVPTGSQLPIGQTITINGVEFTSDDSQRFTYNTFDGTDATVIHGYNIFEMLRSNFAFKDLDIQATETAGVLRITIQACTVGAMSPWGADFSNYVSNPLPSVVSVDAGLDTVTVAGYKMWYQLYQEDEPPGKQISQCEPVPACFAYDESTDSYLPIPVDLSHDLRQLVSTTIPSIYLTYPATILRTALKDESIFRRFRIKFGSVRNAPTCGSSYTDVFQTPIIEVAHAICQDDDPDGFTPYLWNVATNPLAKFWTTRPSCLEVCRSGFGWFWYWLNVESNEGNIRAVHVVRYYDSAGTQVGVRQITMIQNEGVYMIPAGTGQNNAILSGIPTIAEHQVFIDSVAASEVLREKLIDCDCEILQILFRTSKGGYDRIDFTHHLDTSISTNHVQVCTNDPCLGTYPRRKLDSERQLKGEDAIIELSLVSFKQQSSNEMLFYFRDFLASPDRLIVVEDRAGNRTLRRLYLESGRVKIYQYGEQLQVKLKGWYEKHLHL